MKPKTLHSRLTASLVALTIGSACLTAPAAAGGSVSIHYAPANSQNANALQTGLQLYSLYNGVKNGASVKQRGRNNAAGIGQNGYGNVGIIHQKGSGHTGTLQQDGNHNAYGLFQFGKNTGAHVVQNGNRQAGTTVQFGW
jgi:hypothetical protein